MILHTLPFFLPHFEPPYLGAAKTNENQQVIIFIDSGIGPLFQELIDHHLAVAIHNL
jgi:hypothetical protein